MSKIIKLDSVNSTNTYINHLLTDPAGLPEGLLPADGIPDLPFAVTAREQYAGRGRYGRSFHSPADSGVYMSYAFSGSYDIDTLLQLTVVAAAVVHSVLRQHCNDELSIKWINDIYRGDRKVAGILTERVDDPSCTGKYYIIIGVGINVIPAPIPYELSEVIGFIGNGSSSGSECDLITSQLVEAFDNVFGDPSAADFPLLIDYYRMHCRELPADFGDKLLNK